MCKQFFIFNNNYKVDRQSFVEVYKFLLKKNINFEISNYELVTRNLDTMNSISSGSSLGTNSGYATPGYITPISKSSSMLNFINIASDKNLLDLKTRNFEANISDHSNPESASSTKSSPDRECVVS